MFKRGKNAFKTWNRRYFLLKDFQLTYLKKATVSPCTLCGIISRVADSVPPPQDEPTVVAADVRLCTVKEAEETERRNCFSLVMPDK